MCAMSAPLDVPEHLFTAIDHVGIAVADLDEAVAFYRDTYGMRVLHEETTEEHGSAKPRKHAHTSSTTPGRPRGSTTASSSRPSAASSTAASANATCATA